MSFGWKRNFMMIENQLDFHFLRSNARKDGTQSSGDRSNSDVHQSNDNLQSSFNSSRIWKPWEFCVVTYPSYESQEEIEKSEAGSEDPDVDHGDEGENQSPNQSQGNSQKSREDFVEPFLGLAEQDKR